MRRLMVVIHTSLDGFIAGSRGELDGFNAGEENLQFVCNLTRNADTAIFGRKSFELLEGAWPNTRHKPGATKAEIEYSNWYNSARKIVITTTLAEKDHPGVTLLKANLAQEIIELKQALGKDVLFFGGAQAFQTLFHFDLPDCYQIFVNPVIFGKGIPLFKPSLKSCLTLTSSTKF